MREATADTTSPGSLIAADRVEGTAVYNRQGDHLGAIKTVMIDKPSGKVAYAVMSFGGFLGIGEKYHPLPWSTADLPSRPARLRRRPRQGAARRRAVLRCRDAARL